MNIYPAFDPIPLPAPVWLFKVLHVLTLALHFSAMQMLVGGVLLALGLNLRGAGGQGAAALAWRDAASVLGRRLPIVMTYVINLGVPPLLFSQVLYGPALYTSSVLIGAWWISVIVLLTLGYWLLYRFSAGCESGKSVWWIGVLVWLIVAAIGKIYTTNMTLMLRPEVWQNMYAASAHGVRLPPSDPTMMPRWLCMMVGGLTVAGVWMVWLAGRAAFERPVRECLARTGGLTMVVGMVLQTGLAFWVYRALSPEVQGQLGSNLVYHGTGLAWLVLAAGTIVLGLWNWLKQPASPLAAWLTALVGFLGVTCLTLYRDGIRDLTLLTKHYDVWNQPVAVNWSVLILFLVLFVAGLGMLGWLISVMVRAKPVSGKVTA